MYVGICADKGPIRLASFPLNDIFETSRQEPKLSVEANTEYKDSSLEFRVCSNFTLVNAFSR